MRRIVATLFGASLLAGLIAPVSAGAYERQHDIRKRTKKSYAVRPRVERRIEYDVNKLPFGSRIWWEQMVREGRARG